MKHPSAHAKENPDKPAYIMGASGEVVTYGQLNDLSARGANLMRNLGLAPGDHIALLMENHAQFFAIIWAAQRAGLIFTAISSHLRPSEIAYILSNCDAKLLLTSAQLESAAIKALALIEAKFEVYSVDKNSKFPNWSDTLTHFSAVPPTDECAGVHMLYSSGTTGHPKGVYPVWAPHRPIDHVEPGMAALRDFFQINQDSVYLSPAPLYHAAPLIFNQLVMFQGGTSIVMEKFDAEQALSLIEKHRVTIAQFVPIMFIRMLKMPPEERIRFDVSSLKKAIHAAAPCPVGVKQQMIDWWGPIIFEYYSSTENAGATLLNTEQWQSHPGSVGAPLGCVIHILDDHGNELQPGEIGEVFFENPHMNFEYYKEPGMTAETRNEKGWATVGDIGYVDKDGFLYLSDRKNFMIISGGVNIYPQEVENVLIMHPKVADVAVFGVPNEEFGEEVKAVVQPTAGVHGSSFLESELITWCREQISPVKVPRSIDFSNELPRLDNGKLYKKKIADQYRAKAT